MSDGSRAETEWHVLEASEAVDRLGSTFEGLSGAEVEQRLLRWGLNRLPAQPPPAAWQIVLRQFASPLIYILVIAAFVSAFIGDWKDAGFIAAVLAINAAIGAYQEWKAEQSSQALRKMLQIRATVRRGGRVREVAAESLVPGDIVLLESGNRVPADLRLLSAHGLAVDESLLTGESVAVGKDADWRGEPACSLADRVNLCFAGSMVARGRGQGMVVATGSETQVGQLAVEVSGAVGGRPPLLERMERFTNVIAVATLSAAAMIGGISVLLGRYGWEEMFLFVVALAVSAIPEGLPVAMTVALAIATTRMARRGVIVRRLTAVEGLGSCTMIATDKTGTLTVNELTVRAIRLPDGQRFSVTGEGFEPVGQVLADDVDDPGLMALVRAGVLCNEGSLGQSDGQWEWRGDAVDIALLALGYKLECDRSSLLKHSPQIAEIPFESEQQYAATFHDGGSGPFVIVKGAPERVLELCAIHGFRERLETMAAEMASDGFRVLAIAQAHLDSTALEQGQGIDRGNWELPPNLTFLGFVGMIDPLRPGVREAAMDCRKSGVKVTMVTGDHRLTAAAIARDLGLLAEHEADHAVVTGPELSSLPREAWPEVIARARVFARVGPHQKLEIVRAAQAVGHFVAVTGDGVNDAPALRMANIGVAMGKSGTDVAREAAELVISDDNFSTIVAGIEEGRIAYDNIRKVVFLLLSTGAAELLLVLLTVVAGLHLPLLPVQLLWLNLVTNGIQGVALAFEPGEGDTLHRKPRPTWEPVFNRLMVERLVVAVSVMGCVAFAAFQWMLQSGWSESEARNVLLLLMVLFENFHIGNCRSETKSAFALSPFRSPILLFGALGAFTLHVVVMHVPWMEGVLGTAPVSPLTWLIVVVLAFTIVPAMELHQWWWRRRKPT